jgi:hypothetical protein
VIPFAALYRQTLKTVPYRYRMGWALALAILGIMVPLILDDPYAASSLLLSAGALFAATIWNVDPAEGGYQLWLTAGTAKSALVAARMLTALTYAAPWGVVSALVCKLKDYPESPLHLLLLSQLTIIFFLATVGLAVSLGWGRRTGPAVILGFLVLAMMLNPIWQQEVRWVMPSLSLFHPGLPDPVNLLGLAGTALVVTAAAVYRIGRGESHDRAPKLLLAAAGLLLLAGSGLVEAWDRHELAASAFRSLGDPWLMVAYRGLSEQEASALHGLGRRIQETFLTTFGLSVPGTKLVVYRSRDLRQEHDPDLPAGDHAYKLRYNGQRSLRFGARYNWPARLTRDLFRDAWRQFPLDPDARRLLDVWGDALAEWSVGPAAAGIADPEKAMADGLASLQLQADSSRLVTTELAAQLFLYRLLQHEGTHLLGRAQAQLTRTPVSITPYDLYQALRRAAADPAFVDGAWEELLRFSSTTN